MAKVPRADTSDAVHIQRKHYAESAQSYDDVHGGEHGFGLSFLIEALEQLRIQSVLDVGCGTGKALMKIKRERPDVSAIGVEPCLELRQVGYSKGLSQSELVDGDAMNLAFADGSFDLVCEFGALHHIPMPSKAVSEMLRVSRKGIFISDSNNFGQGSKLSRWIKQSVNMVGLWPIVDFVKTKGKGYRLSEGDGLSYSYSVFNDLKLIRNACDSVYFLNTVDSGPNLYRTAASVALLGVKE